jgi:ATP-binding cassette, subfamily B, bacterial MsbA
MADISRLLRLLLDRPRLLLLSLVFATISAGGISAGILGIQPVLDNMLGKHRTLANIATEFNSSLPPLLHIPEPLINLLPTDVYKSVIWIILGLGLLSVIGAAANFLHQFFSLTLVIETVASIRERAFNRVIHLPLRTLMPGRQTSPSDAISRIATDTGVVALGLSSLVSKSLSQITRGFAGLVTALFLDWRTTLIVCSIGPVLAIILRKTGKHIRRATHRALESQAGLFRTAAEALSGLRVVKVHTTESHEAQRFNALSQQIAIHEKKIRFARALATPIIELIVIAIIGLLVIITAKAILDGALDKSSFLLVLAALGLAGTSLKPLTAFLNDIQQASAAVQRLDALMGQPIEQDPDAKRPILPRHARSITFDNVSLRYPSTPPTDPPAVKNVSITIPHGSTVAFVGPNGCGKTSLLSLLPRLFDPDPNPIGSPPGKVFIDDTDIATVDLASLRNQIAVVTQDTVLFHGTIRENIAYGNPKASDAQVRDAARRARADEFILSKPNTYDEHLGERGAGLSGGQRQRLAIARAILRDPAILILDEATSMIDSRSEHLIAEAIDDFVTREHSRRTCLIVAHRLATVISADQIVVMDQGSIIDKGTHAELMSRCETYRSLVAHQLINSPTTQPLPA